MIDNGIYKTDDLYYNKLSFRSNISAQLTNNIKAVFNIAGYFDKQEYPAYGVWNVVRGTATSLPTHPVYANGNPKYFNRVQDGGGVNPVAISSSDLTGYGRNNNDNYQTSLELRYSVPSVKGLEIKALGAFDKSFWAYKGLNLELPLYDYDVEKDNYNATYFHSPQSIQNNFANRYYLTLRGQADYKTSILGSHNIAATLVYEQRETFERNAMILKYYDFYTNDQINQASDTNAQSNGVETTTRAMSYIGRLNYDYKGKYLVEFSGRYDGSYRYHLDKRWGLFPVVSAGWRISEESFMKNLSFLSNLKFRGSYGQIGQDTGAPFQYIPGFTTGGGWYEFSNGETTLGLNTPALVNENLTWMTNTITDIGVDIGVFNNKLSLTFDYFNKLREGLLTRRNVSLPNTYGGTFPEENLNKDRVQGIEISLTHQNTISGVYYSVSGNLTYSQSRNVYVERAPFTDSWDYYQGQTVGRNSGIVKTYNVIGQYKSLEEIANAPVRNGSLGNQYARPGDYIYEDVNGDNVIDGNDAVPKFFDNTPRLNYGLTLNASWNGFDFSALFQGAALFSQAFDGMYVKYFYEDANIPARYMDRWHQADPYDPSSAWVAGKYPAMRMVNNANNGALYAASTAWRKDCKYLRLKNVEIGYTFNQRLIKKTGIDNLRLFVSGSNLYTWCDEFIKAFDPERIAGSYNNGWVYPLQKTYNIGLSIDF
jgi:TonB-linked SusC/RagA family outer membrane protein